MAPTRPQICDIDDIKALEQTPYEDRDCEKTVYDLVLGGASINPDKPAIINLPHGDPFEPGITLSYREFLRQTTQTANLLRELGIERNDVVAVLLPIIPQNIVAMIGALTAGILCPINWMLKADHIAGILNAVNAKVLIALAPTDGYEIWDKVENIDSQVASLTNVIQVTLPGETPGDENDFDQLIAEQNGDNLDFVFDATKDDIAVYAHTGGTTGVPKVAKLRNGAFGYKCWAYSELLENKPEHVVFAGSPLFHIGGIVYHTVTTLAAGATSLMIGPMGFRNKAIIEAYWHLVEKYEITDFFGVPTTLTALANIPPGDADISSLRPYTMTGSAGLPIEISRYFEQEIGVRILSNYGMTENTATITLPPRNGDPRFGSSGLRLPYTKVRIVRLDADKKILRDCETDEIGDIIVNGPGIIPGYLDEKINAELFLDGGWLHTGDLGRFDADEYLWVTGRAKDVIIRSGHNIDPLAIEDALRKHDDVALVGAIGQPDSYAGELPVAFVQLKPERSVSAETLREFAASHISERSAIPKEITIVEQLPLTAVGKIFKPELRKMASVQVFTKLLADIGANFKVDMIDDNKYGSICSISVGLENADNKTIIEEKINSVMSAFTIHFKIAWRS